MNLKLVLCLVFLSIINPMDCLSGKALQNKKINQNYQEKLQKLLDEEWQKYKKDKTNWNGEIVMYIIAPEGEYFASSDKESPSTKDTFFRAASTTKTFTAASIMYLYQKGYLDINDRITDVIRGGPNKGEKYVEYKIPYYNDMTIRQLLEHRAGVFDITNNEVPGYVKFPYAGKKYISYITDDLNEKNHSFTFDEMVKVVEDTQISFFSPGADYHYSNTGYSVLGKIIENVSGERYDKFVEKHFLLPNKIKAHFPCSGSEQKLPEPYANGFDWYENTLYNVTKDNVSGNIAEGNLITTPSNLAKWIKLLMTGQTCLNKEYVGMMQNGKDIGNDMFYGLGCIYTPGFGYGHNGGHDGYLTEMRYNPEFKIAIVISARVVNIADIKGELLFLIQLGKKAEKLFEYL